MTETERERWYRRRCKALESLLVCYRVGKHPTEKLHDELATTGERIDHDGNWREVPDAGAR